MSDAAVAGGSSSHGVSDQAARAFAHDLDNLFAIVIGNLDLLDERSGLDDDTRKLVRASLQAALRATDLVRGFRRQVADGAPGRT